MARKMLLIVDLTLAATTMSGRVYTRTRTMVGTTIVAVGTGVDCPGSGGVTLNGWQRSCHRRSGFEGSDLTIECIEVHSHLGLALGFPVAQMGSPSMRVVIAWEDRTSAGTPLWRFGH